MPLGVPDRKQLIAAREALDRIGVNINQNDSDHETFVRESNKFYAMMPHVGVGKLPKDDSNTVQNNRPVIKTIELVNMENQLINQIESVLDALQQNNSVDNFCANFLEIQFEPVRKSECKELLSNFNFDSDDVKQIENVLKVNKPIWDANYRSDLTNHYYLFYTIDAR